MGQVNHLFHYIKIEIYYLDYSLRERVVVFILSNTVCQELVCEEQEGRVASESVTEGSVAHFASN